MESCVLIHIVRLCYLYYKAILQNLYKSDLPGETILSGVGIIDYSYIFFAVIFALEVILGQIDIVAGNKSLGNELVYSLKNKIISSSFENVLLEEKQYLIYKLSFFR